jgi:hypothetical protein
MVVFRQLTALRFGYSTQTGEWGPQNTFQAQLSLVAARFEKFQTTSNLRMMIFYSAHEK